MKQRDVIDTAIASFKNLTNWELKIELDNNLNDDYDGHAIIFHELKNEKITFLVDIKNELRGHDTWKLLSENRKEECLLITQYISKQQRELLKVNNVNYIDSSGNCFIHKKNFFVFIDNQKVQEQRQTKTNKLFTEKGMRLIYALLLNNSIINATYRQIANEVDIALGTVGNLLNELEAEGFVKIQNDERRLQNKESLFEKWAGLYDTTLRPHLYQTRMKFSNRNDVLEWQNINLKDAYWGGEPAANLLDNYLTPQEFIIYSEKTVTQLMKDLKLVPDIGGNVILMLPPLHKYLDRKIADPYLIYAELINSKDSRCLEAAERIKEKYIDTKR